MKATLEFDLPEDQEAFDLASAGPALQHVLYRVRNEIFRPARKHGYDSLAIQEVLRKMEEAGVSGEDLVWQLEELFGQILNEELETRSLDI